MTTTAASDVPTVTVELAFGTGALTAASSWTDVTTYVEGFTVNGPLRDRDTGRFNGGSTMIVFNNRDRRFDPSYSAGPYFGNLKPRVQGRIRCTWASVTYAVAYFYVDRWPQVMSQEMYHAEVPITGSDGFRVLNTAMPDSVWAIVVEDLDVDIWYRLGESAGRTMVESGGTGLHGTYEGGATFNHRESLLPYSNGTGGSIEFNGVDMVGRSGPGTLTANGDFTISIIAKMPDEIDTSGSSGLYPVLVRQDPGNTVNTHQIWLLYISADDGVAHDAGCLVFQCEAMTDAFTNPRWSDRPMVPGRTYLITVAYDSAGPSATMYINGVAQTDDDQGFGATTDSSKGRIRIGGEASAHFDAFNGTLSEFAQWDSTLSAGDVGDLYDAFAAPWDGDASGTRVGRVLDAIGWPASLRDIDTGLSTLGPARLEGSALDYLQRIARSEDGLLYMAPDGDLTFVDRTARRNDSRFTTSAGTFSDRNGTLRYESIVTSGWDDESITNVGLCSRVGGTVQTYRDATSIAAYGEKPWDGTGLLVATDGEALDRATHQVVINKDPAFRVESVTLRPRGTTALWPHVLGRQIGDRITIELHPLSVGSAISVDVHISGITHTITDVYTAGDGKTGFDWTTVWTLEPVDPLLSSWAVVGSGANRNRVGTAKASY